jgi:diguanylate cyclase (GGDEF)-like protein
MTTDQMGRRSPARLLKIFGFGAVVAVLAGVTLAAFGVHRIYYAHVCRSAELGAIRLARTILDERPPILTGSAGRGTAIAVAPARLPELDVRIRRYVPALSLLRISLFDRDGRVLYSTEPTVVPSGQTRNAALGSALNGHASSSRVDARVAGGTADAVLSYVPLREGDHVLGALAVTTDISGSRGDFKRMLVLSTALVAAGLVAGVGVLYVLVRGAAREVDQAHRDLEMMAITDVLTGLANRRYLMARAEEECARIRRQRGRDPAKAGVGFIMADIDGFKAVNDTHGHLVGDDILRSVADRIRRVTRRYDIVGRYGGDEFLVVVPGTDFDETGSVAERLWQTVRDEAFAIDGSTARITVSVGFTCAEGDDVQAALKRADEALYRAKNAGRDRIVAF